MEKLTITAYMATPFVTGGGYMTLDALLAGILFDQCQDVEAAHAGVPIRCTDGLFHASAAFYEPRHNSNIAFVANLRADHSLDPDLIKHSKQGGSLHRKLGRTRKRDFGAVMNAYKSIFTASICWYAEGDREQIDHLLRPVRFIGKRRAGGFGEVSRWQIDPGELDGISGIEDAPLRPIPEDRFTGDKSALRVDTAWRPAYWHPGNRAICYAPETPETPE